MKNHGQLLSYLDYAIGILQANNSNSDQQLSQEARIADIIHHKFSWKNLSDEEKQNKRLGLLKLAEKYQDTEKHKKEYNYIDAFYKAYDLLSILLTKLTNINFENENNVWLIRLKTALLIEKELMDEYSHPENSGHYPEKTMLNLLAVESIIQFSPESIIKLRNTFEIMYANWAKKPTESLRC